MRLTLKHLRQRGLLQPFDTLLSAASAPPYNIRFEHPLLSELHSALVLRGDFNLAEALLSRAALAPAESMSPDDDAEQAGPSLFAPFVAASVPVPIWTRLDTDPSIATADGDAPSPRGGHQLVYCAPDPDGEPSGGSIFLFGGWNGSQDLADLWRFDLPLRSDAGAGSGRWTLVSADVTQQGGPSPRSCHKCCFDDATGGAPVCIGHTD